MVLRNQLLSFLNELKRRNVLRVGAAYLVSSWLLIQIAETIFPLFGFDDTPARMVVIVLAIAFIPSMVFSWVFEITPEGLKRDADVDHDHSIAQIAGKKLDRIILVVLALALGYFAFDKFVLDPARDALKIEVATKKGHADALLGSYGDKSIAVLAFSDMSPEHDQEYFSDGIAEELLNVLATVRELRVISRSTAFSFKGSDLTLQEIGEKLKVSYILEGSVRKSGNSIRITAQLIDARTDTHVWSETYDRTLDDVFAIQDQISANIVEHLKITLLNGVKSATKIDPKSYDLYLKAQFIVHTNNRDRIREAQALLDEVLEVEPDYIPALSTLARAYYRAPKFEGLSDELNKAEIHRLVDRIVAIAPNSVTALSWQGWFAYQRKDMQEAAYFYEKALRVDPNHFALLRVMVLFLISIGHSDDAIELGNYLQLRDPNCATCIVNLAFAYQSAGRHLEAAQVREEVFAWHAPTDRSYWSIGTNWLLAGNPEKALGAFEKLSLEAYQEMGEIMVLYELGRIDEFETRFSELRNMESLHPEAIAGIYAWIGNNDKAFEWLDEAVGEHGPVFLGGIKSPLYEKIKSDQRWNELLDKHGYFAEPVEVIDFDHSLVPGLSR